MLWNGKLFHNELEETLSIHLNRIKKKENEQLNCEDKRERIRLKKKKKKTTEKDEKQKLKIIRENNKAAKNKDK